MSNAQPKTGFQNEASRESLSTNLETRLEQYGTDYRKSAPNKTGKGAPGIDSYQGQSGESQGVDFFGYGSKGSANAKGQVQIAGFMTKKSAGNRTTDYGRGDPAGAADASVYRNMTKNPDKYSASNAISGLTQGLRDQAATKGKSAK